MNLKTAKEKIAMIINQYSQRGELISPTSENVKDLYFKMPAYLDLAQKNVCQSKPIKKTIAISHNLPFMPQSWQLETYSHTDQDITYQSAKAYAYSFKVDSDATVYVEGINQDDTVTALDEISAYSIGGFTLFKGVIDIPEGSNFKAVQLRFSGEGYYNIKDIALFNAKYIHYDKIPDFGRYMLYEMPSDFVKVIATKIKRDNLFVVIEDMYWENPKTLAVSSYEQGELKIEYSAMPQTITSETADTYEFEISEQAQGAMIFYAAAFLMQKEDYAQYQLLMQMYSEKMQNLNEDSKVIQRKIKRVY